MDRKIVFFDIDGTIYSFKTGIPDDTVSAIKQLKKNGHIPVICTGRTRAMIYDEFIDVGFEHLIAGAGTYIECDGREIFLVELGADKAGELAEGFIKYGFSPVCEGKDYIYVEECNTKLTEHSKKSRSVYEQRVGDKIRIINPDMHISKISGYFTVDSDMQGMISKFGNMYTAINHHNLLLEMVPKDVSKATGIEMLIGKLGIARENTYAFGDSFNDLEMLKYVKYGAAMGNSDPGIFSEVKYRTGDFDKGGIADGLRMFGLI